MNSRESLLLSIAAGKWVVLPDWLERVATYCKNEKNVGNDEKEWTRVVHLFSSWLSSSEWSLEHFMSVTEEPKESSSTAQSYWLHRQLAKVCAAHRQQRQLTGNTVLGGRSFLLLTPLFSTVGKGGKRTRNSTEQCLYRNEGVPSIKRIVRAGGGSLLNTVGITSLEKKDGTTIDKTPYTYFILDGEVSVKVEETTLGSVTLPLAAETFLTDFMLLLFAQFVLNEDCTTLVASRTDVLVDSVERIRVTAGHRSKRKKRVTLKLTVFLEELRETVADDSLLDSLDRSEEEIKAYYFFKKTLQLISYHRSLQQRNAPNTSYFTATAPATLPLEGKRAWDAEWRSFILRYTAQQTDMHGTLGQQITQSTASLTNQLPSKEKFSLSVKSIDCIAHAIAGDEESGATLVTFTV
ncbi:hypothetical protein ADEAN_000249900 [Angomonas deanei]|uniref:Uncharacterized protein n=1 Tax=Angomonas deanei TaxID=59799 RepID=A0A7G2C5M5_9TRYP|nr:hypothetical protein ADEAN_000249900 [Angomonas deanei]